MHHVWSRDYTLADDHHGRDDRPRMFSLGVRALTLKLLRWIPSIINVTSLTSLEVLEIGTTDNVPLNLPGLVSLTKPIAHKASIAHFHTSLVVCELVVKTDFDLLSPRNLTSVGIEFHPTKQPELPTQLKEGR